MFSGVKKRVVLKENVQTERLQKTTSIHLGEIITKDPFTTKIHRIVICLQNTQNIQPEDGSSSKSREKALVVVQEDEGFSWNEMVSKTQGLTLMEEIQEIEDSMRIVVKISVKMEQSVEKNIEESEIKENAYVTVEAESTRSNAESEILPTENVEEDKIYHVPPDFFKSNFSS
ncbi:hypothetical protein Hanom_Chr03g00221011 [Helianthus anomalus]